MAVVVSPSSFAFRECETFLNHPDPQVAKKVWEMCEAVNTKRREWGRAPVYLSVFLHRAAQSHADDMAWNRFFSHVGSDGSNFWNRIFRTGFDGNRPWPLEACENIGRNDGSVWGMMEMWLNSPPHRDCMMWPYQNQIGVGFAGGYWTLDFTN